MAGEPNDDRTVKGTPPPPSDTPVVPSIPDYELLRCIGSGSFGDVWLARSLTGQYRAIKVIYRNRFTNQKSFEREFHGILKFEPISRSHDGFMDILHVGKNDPAGFYYYVMELADDLTGAAPISPAAYRPKTLREEFLKRGRFFVDGLLKLGLSLTDALTTLHSHGLFHRDIKPSNIIFVDGVPKLADIGLVASLDESMSFVGTEGFIPPEGPKSATADLYSLGKVLYELHTGLDRLEFPNLPTAVADDPDAGRVRGLNDIILKACEPNVHRRYQSAREMHADLLTLQQQGKLPKPVNKQRATVLAAAAGVLLVAILTGVWLMQRRSTVEGLAPSGPFAPASVPQGGTTASKPAPLLHAQAQTLIKEGKFEEALTKINEAIAASPTVAEYHYLKGNICQSLLKLDEAAAAYARTLELSPGNMQASVNLQLCLKLQRDNEGKEELSHQSLRELQTAMHQQGRLEEATALASKAGTDKQLIYAFWVGKLEQAGWGKILRDKGRKLELAEDGKLRLAMNETDITDLSPIQGMPLKYLGIAWGPKVNDLSPLRNTPLEELDVSSTPVTDLSPLKGMRLKMLWIAWCRGISDISPLEGMPLKHLSANLTAISDISPLKGMPLTDLTIADTRVTDLGPLRGMRLERLWLDNTPVSDLSPLRGMPLRELELAGCRNIRDLTPLADCKQLEVLVIPSQCTDIEFLRQLPNLKRLAAAGAWIPLDHAPTVSEFWLQYEERKRAVAAHGGNSYGYRIDKDEVVFVFDPVLFTDFVPPTTIREGQIGEVLVAGNFNSWLNNENGVVKGNLYPEWRMQKDDENRFILRKKLGEFDGQADWQFKFVVNGKFWSVPPGEAGNTTLTPGGEIINLVLKVPGALGHPAALPVLGYRTSKDEVFFDFDPATFNMQVPADAEVHVAGEFNNWLAAADGKLGEAPAEWKMQKVADNRWELRKKLSDFQEKPQWQFKFVVNKSQWIEVPATAKNRAELDGFANLLLTIPPPATNTPPTKN